MSYRHLITHQRRFVTVGFALCFFSSFGQTFFIGVFGGAIRQEFQLSDGQLGGLYSAATLASACLLFWLGRAVDHHDLRRVTGLVCLGLAIASAGMAVASSPVFLFVSLLLLRLSGQGLMTHIGMTSMARYFDEHRAKAISLAGLGFSQGHKKRPKKLGLCHQVLDRCRPDLVTPTSLQVGCRRLAGETMTAPFAVANIPN